MNVRLGRKYQFFAAHRLHQRAFSDRDNERIYGKCNHPGGHGHSYSVTVVVEGTPASDTRMVMDLDTLDERVARVLDTLAYTHIDQEVPAFAQAPSTTEHIAVYIYRELAPAFCDDTAALARVEVSETRNNHFEVERISA